MKNQTVVPTEKPDTLRTNKFMKDGYTFVYWNTKADGSGTNFEADHTANGLDNYTVHGIVTLYAIWGAPRTITYNANGGSGDDIIQDVTENLEWTVQGNSFTRDGYAFVGWNTAKDGTGDPYEAGTTQRYSKTEDMTLYAQWGPQHIVTYKANDGTGADVTVTIHSHP